MNLIHVKSVIPVISVIEWKELSDSSSGGVFGEWDYNEGLKFGDFRYWMCRSKCFGPNETNFINLWQKLLILEPLYEKKT